MYLIFSDFFRPKVDGVSISIERTIEEYLRLEKEFELFVPKLPNNSYEDPPYVHRFQSLPGLIYPDFRITLPVDAKNWQKILRKKYELVHSHTPGPLGLVAVSVAKLKNLPHFHTFHGYFRDYRHYFKVQDYNVFSSDMIDDLSRWWANQLDFLVVPSWKVLNWLTEIGVNTDMRVIPTGINLAKFNTTQESNYLVNKGIVKKNDFVMLSVGRLAAEKSLDDLITFFSEYLAKSKVTAKLVIAGDGPIKQKLKDTANKYGLENSVIFLGMVPVDVMPKIYASADTFVFLSRSETQGIVVTEALASGLPLVIANDLAYKGMIEEGVNGFKINNKEEFIDKLLQISDPVNAKMRKKFGANSLAISKNFDIKNTVNDLVDYYEYGLSTFDKNARSVSRKFRDSMSLVANQIHNMSSEIRGKININ